MNKKAAAIVGGILVLGLGVFGFTKLNSGSQNQQTQQEQSAEQTTVQITDANGEKAELKKNPKLLVIKMSWFNSSLLLYYRKRLHKNKIKIDLK